MEGFVNLVCPSCDGVSRLRREQVGAGGGAVCLSCGAPLFAGRTVDLDDPARFQKHIVSNDLPVLVAFWAPWCGACRVMAPEFEKAAGRLEPAVRLGSVDTAKAEALGERYQVHVIPTMILFRHGREVARQSGAVPSAGIAEFAAAHLVA